MKMNKIMLGAMALVPSILLAASFEANIPVDHVYIPAGFDSNDNSEVIVTGYLPNLCYKAPKSQVSIVGNKISVSMKALKNSGMSMCAQMIVPFVEHVNVGVLDKGKYNLAVSENTAWEKNSNINISEASSNSIDEVVYANVEEVVRVDSGRKVLLKGYNPSDCFELKEIVSIDNGVDTISVMPKMKQIRQFCPKKMIPFEYEWSVPENLKADKVLLHVRVMDGKSMNSFFNNQSQEE